MARKRHHKPGDLTQLRRVLWDTILTVESLLDVRPHDPAIVLKSAHALAQLAGAYRGVIEIESLEARITALEAAERTP